MTTSFRLRLAAAMTLITISACGGQIGVVEPVAAVRSMSSVPDFAQTKGWLGADGASTIVLGDGRVLWLFGDTFVGSLKPDGGCADGTKMVNNTIAVQKLPRGEDAGSTSFHWGAPKDGEATSWAISPAALGEKAKNHWMWPAGGGVVTGEGPNERLVLFFMMMRRRDKSDSVWNFQQHGTATVTVLNPRDEPSEWKLEAAVLHDREAALDAGDDVRMITWGPMVVVEPGDDARVLVYGVDVSDVHRKRLVLARAPRASLAKFDTWEFRTSDGWSSDEADAAAIAEGLVDEFSVNRLKIDGRDRWMLTQIEPNLGRRVFVRVADRPEGPWSEGETVFTCPEPTQDRRLFVYSAKAHPEVSGEGAIVVTYCVNSSDFWHAAANVALYRPRNIRVPQATLDEMARRAGKDKSPGEGAPADRSTGEAK